jgi:hypothetical protein
MKSETKTQRQGSTRFSARAGPSGVLVVPDDFSSTAAEVDFDVSLAFDPNDIARWQPRQKAR